MKKRKIILLISIILVVFLLVLYLYFENVFLEVSNYDIVSDKLPKEFNNFKIIQISDYHNSKTKKLNKDLIDTIKNEKPNMIVITGDFIDSRDTNIDVAIDLIKNINGIAPIYYVTGNHEARVIVNYKELKENMEEQNVIVLENETEVIEIGENKINIIGINDPQMVNENLIEDSSIIDKELEVSNYDSTLFSILLSHRPETFGTYVDNNIDLVFSGHAHGGQIRLPFIGGIIAPNQGVFPKYTNGLFKENNTNMIVSRGLGNSIIPLRVNNRPELVIVTLKNNYI